ncbi:MAG: 30S ribosomal protein S11 [Candidatus Pacebacteria bacterium]|jgi:small subunit ribosomal protein S11|nr:30S ribosomal protein S11 [Candidatus Paceibacterota bacterium]MBP9839428.1 30S ribosomal protein S11 [Candidatus Paceibacterota bacterium]MDQ5922552.1 small subunit ribosomal protein [Patescibacteria group bacterium]
MGKVKITNKEEASKEEILKEEGEAKTVAKSSKKKITSGILFIDATFNNTKVLFADKIGNTLFWSSSGSLGFKGAKKGTPFAASKVGDIIGTKASALGVKDADVVVRGVGSGREPAIRAFMAYGIEITGIKDATPVPHNGPKPKKPRRV